ncbi:WD40 repeat-like protein [Venustampulla echinocandica]|uniref:WD40 repeat-like protein n=1 Tax=Venustampulla echinocandica TaxID=2656787 RepID=A0A370TVT8_9HELO|nr:WD40 repeat-like protein [Venustampulla echinocandica]RDL39642.1 WD40 repeat-like protein [Venustampulla echinocandica]
MSAVLPKIKVIETQNLDRSGAGASLSLDSPSNTTDGGQSARPKSATSSEGNAQINSKRLPPKSIRSGSSKDINSGKPTSPPGRPETAIDPLSHHILKRTNTENTIPSRLRNIATVESGNAEATSPVSPDIAAPGRQSTPEITRSDSNPSKEKKKGVSFLSRFSIIGGKKKDQFPDLDDESELGDPRTEGMNAHVFSSSVGANGYIPQHKEPPRYIKVRAHNKKIREFNRMFLSQELSGTKSPPGEDKVPGIATTEAQPQNSKLSKLPKSGGAIWAMEFSKDGKYLAAAGRDQVVRIWAVISTAEERQAHEHEEDVSSSTTEGERLNAPVFRSKPVREFEGHTGEILDLSWSKNNFLLSSSMDKTVRLWHTSRQECLCTFKHKDFVTTIAFHPTDDRFFLAGSLDSILRLWSIPDKSVAFWNQLPDLITAVAFSPDGKIAMAGVLSGLCLFYETEGLKYHTQIHVRSSRGKNAKGSKITGIRTMTFPPGESEADIKILITSNDSRVRMYNLRDKSLEMKFRGHENTCSQINATFSDDTRYVICGSEDRKAYIWTTGPADSENKDKRPLEMFEAHSDMVTAAVIAPTKARQLLSASGDPIYDLCNPPPVTLLSREESTVSATPRTESERGHSDPLNEPPIKKPEESPAYLARCIHPGGNIIITADYLGNIKVFRQDCAHQKRLQNNWETGSAFSKKMLGRSGSIMTKNSGGSHSRRNSASQSSTGGPHMPSDHILSWRNHVLDNNSIKNGARSSRSDRSVSPGKFSRVSIQSQNNLASAARQQPYAGALLQTTPSVSTISPPPSLYGSKTRNLSQPPTPSFHFQSASDENALKIDSSGKNYQFWNPSSWRNEIKAQAAAARDPSKLDTEISGSLQRGGSVVSKLTSEEDTSELEDEESEGEALVCKKCGGKDFRARKVVGKAGQRLVCTKCGTTAE